MTEATGEKAGTSTEVDTTETTMTATGVSADATAMRMTTDDHTGTARIATDTDHIPVQGRRIDVLTTATATKGGIDHAGTGIAAHLGHGRPVGVVTTMSAESIAGLTQVLSVPARRGRSLDHHTVPGITKLADIKDDARPHMSEEEVGQNLIARHRRRRNAMRQQSKLNVRGVWLPCNQMHRSWKAIAELVLRI
jgi:hypothetical protein